LATLAHELRNPLHSIRGAVELLCPDEKLEPEARLSCQVIDQQVNHLSRLIDDLLDVARIARDKLELRKQKLDFSEILKNALHSSRTVLELHGHRPQVAFPPAGVHIDGDPVRLNQVFVNLLHNAAKYTPEGGAIWLTGFVQGDRAVVSVKDNGIGIAKDKLPHLFETFYQIDSSLERSTSGLGLGLSLARHLVELHGGTITARSEGLGMGSEFVVSLPILAQPPSTEEGQLRGPASDGSSRWRILIVDDGPRTREMYSMLLSKRGHTVESAADGRSGIEMVETFCPDVVLLDVGMPGLNGFESCQRIRALPHGKDSILIAVTGWAQEEVQERADQAGFDGILVKPVGVQEILRLVQTITECKERTRS
jgi:CheY-like chemotaxis protein/two-component sensor histidine kinase